MSDRLEYHPKLKMVLAGESAVGKTTLRKRLAMLTADEISPPTIGFDFGIFDVWLRACQRTTTVHVYDLAGQERFNAVTSNQFRGADGVVLMFDLTVRESFDALQRRWLPMIKNYTAPEAPPLVMVVGNKLDLVTGPKQLACCVTEDEVGRLLDAIAGEGFPLIGDVDLGGLTRHRYVQTSAQDWNVSADRTPFERMLERIFIAKKLDQVDAAKFDADERARVERARAIAKGTGALNVVNAPASASAGSSASCCQ
jgi:small GTP-binding protein